jgi:bile acid:Na+ symporter, BASS family
MEATKFLALVLIVSAMFGAGLQVDRRHLVETLHHYDLIGKALLANFVLVPAFAFAMVAVAHLESGIATGILLMAMAPGVPFIVRSAGRKLGGSLAFATEIAVFFSALSVITIPITARVLLPPDAQLRVPAQSFLTTLIAFQLAPLLLGIFIAPYIAANVKVRALKVVDLVFMVAGVVFLVLAFPKLATSVGAVYGFGRLAVIAAIGIFSLAAGWLFGGPENEHRRTLAIATDLRNVGLCLAIGTAQFADTLAVPAIVAYFVVTFCLSIPVRIYLKRTMPAVAA